MSADVLARAKPRRGTTSAMARGLIGFAVLAAAYEGFARLHLINPALLPPASAVLPRVGELLVDPQFLGEVLQTLQAVLLGVGLAALIALPVGLVVGSYAAVSTAATPTIEVLRSIPGIAIIPLLVLIVGQGLEMKVVVVAFVTGWPLLYNTVYGVRGVDRIAIESARSFRAGTLRTWVFVVLPSAAPLVLASVRLAFSTGLTVAIAAEISVGTQSGIGHYILLASQSGLDHVTVYAAVVVAGLMGYGLNWLTTVTSARTVAWSERSGGS
jgi:NitT/TauT family transport system permease protein